ncbi:MAG: galactose-1-phosphate uridylyltransferase [Candidatus Omnitrophota bacterium]|nr:MAG: galactose-1-phosphate uridylyltransferase [Candidatus Omnitrophota bacterium]
MSQLRRDPITGRWIIVNYEKVVEPEEFSFERAVKSNNTKKCPFCPGNEHMTPPEIVAHRNIGAPNTPGWTIRVVPNKYPALEIKGDLNKQGIGVFDRMNGIGAHEVIVDIPHHMRDVADISDEQAEEIIWSYISRNTDLRKDKRFKYILIFRNYGKSAGASLEHPHSQLIALPIVPKRVNEELNSSLEYYNYKDRCVFCDILVQELSDKERIVEENDFFISFCPFVSRFPYEMWIMPKRHESHFTSLQKEEVKPLGTILRNSMKKLKKLLNNPPYNYIIHTSPINGFEKEYYHWHIEIMPKLVNVAGFEWGSGFYVNPIPPEVAARNLMK